MQQQKKNGNRQEEKRKPAFSMKLWSDRSTIIEAAVWANEMQGDNGNWTAYSVTFSRQYRDEKGTWNTNHSYRQHDLACLGFLLQKALSWSLEQKAETNF